MKEKITQIRKDISQNNVKEALNQLLDIADENEQYEDLVDDIIYLQSTNSEILSDEVKNSQKKEYKKLVKETLGIIKEIKKASNKNIPTLKQSDNIGQNIKMIRPSSDKEGFLNIAYLVPNPIDRNLDCDFNYLRTPFKSYNAIIDCYYLNIETLQNLEDYDYIFIKSEIFKGNIYIEDEYLESRLISITNLEDNIIGGFKGVIIIAEGDLNLENITIPVVHIKNLKNQIIKDFLFKCFKKPNLDSLNPSDYISVNLENFELLPCSKGNSEMKIPNPDFPIEMDINSLKSFIGRHDEQPRLASKIIDLNYSGKVLTVKGAGGMGKTTITNKIAMELVLRNYFSDGLSFVACEHISSYELFEAKIAVSFGMDNITDFPIHIRKFERFDKLIILDNFETLLNLDTKEEVDKVKSLVELISDYASIIITSREIIGFESEEVLPLNRLSTEDGLNLFLQNSKRKKLSKNDEKILREDIIEELLNNNPLAIKIISSPHVLPSSKSMEDLKEDLEKDFFSKTSAEIDTVFQDDVDTNIERKRSIYHSINYSYQKLRTSEKLAFELLHLFPDGISSSNFKKCFSNKKSTSHIKDRDITALENKSLVEQSQGVIKLQSIISRFATYQFANRSNERKTKYYEDAYDYNAFIMTLGKDILLNKYQRLALEIVNSNIFNLLYALEYIPKMVNESKNENHHYLNYIDDLGLYITSEGALIKYINLIRGLKGSFEGEENADLLIDIMEIYVLYHNKYFDETYQFLKEKLPFDRLESIANVNSTSNRILDSALSIYAYEGYVFECMKLMNNHTYYELETDFMFFYIGEYSEMVDIGKYFYYYEYLLSTRSLDVEELEDYIDKIYYRNHLDKMQTTYTLSKCKVLSIDDIDKLVVTNPYTKGLKKLMFAFNENDYEKTIIYYEEAIECLTHIKYYYIEAIYFYAKFLKSKSSGNYNEQFNKGLELAKKYQYRFLIHQFYNLKDDLDTLYNPDDYPLDVDFDFNEFVRNYSENRANTKNNSPERRIKSKTKIKKLPSISNRPPLKPALYVEGPTDKDALITAFELFTPELITKIDVISELDEREFRNNKDDKGGGVNWVKSRIKGWLANKYKEKAGALFDSDDIGNKAFTELNNEKAKAENQTTARYIKLFKLPNVYGVSHLSHLKNLKLQIPVALEEMFPQKTWEYAQNEGWLENREGLDKIVPKSKFYDAQHDGIVNFLSKNKLSNDLYLNYHIPKKHKEKFMNYLVNRPLEEKKENFKEFENIVKEIEVFYNK